jgi:hypothetical protein
MIFELNTFFSFSSLLLYIHATTPDLSLFEENKK